MSFEELIKALQDSQEIPGGVTVPRGSLRVGPGEAPGDEPILLASGAAGELTDEEINELAREISQPD